MVLAAANILPSAYYDGLSTLWGGCAYVGSAIVAAGLAFQTIRGRPDPGTFIWLLTKVFMIGLATLFLREWLMRLNDVVTAFGSMMGIDPSQVDARFIQYLSGKTAADPNASVWDVIWGTQSIGTAFTYAILWLFGWLSWCVQYIVKLVGGVLLTAGWAVSPIFLAFYMIRPMAGVAQKFVVGVVALVCWPFGWAIAAVVTNAMLDAAATANLMPLGMVGMSMVAPALTLWLVGAWMLISSVLAPWITTKVLLMGANPAGAFAQGTGDVLQSAFSGGVGAGVTVASGGSAAPAVIAAAAVGAMAAGSESAVRGGGPARTTNAAISGLSGLYRGRLAQRGVEAAEMTAEAQRTRADVSSALAAELTDAVRRRSKSGFDSQPHHDDPNQAAIDIESYDKPKRKNKEGR